MTKPKQKRIKWDINKVRHFVEVESGSWCKLLSEEYANQNTKMIFKCRCGEEFLTTFKHFRYDGKKKCGECSGYGRWNYEKVKRYVETESGSGCKLISDKYINHKSNLEFECTCGKPFSRRFDNFRLNKQYKCYDCTGFQDWNYDKIKYFVEVSSGSGCKLISKKYKKSDEDLELLCKCGEPFKRGFNSFKHQKAYKCEDCIGKNNWSINKIKKHLYERCNLISTEYTKNSDKLKFQCNCGEPFERAWADVISRKQYSCGWCMKNIYWDISKVKYYVEIKSNSGCKLISKTYVGHQSDLDFYCKCGEPFHRTINNFYHHKQWLCVNCSKKKSKGEMIVSNLLERLMLPYNIEERFEKCRSKNTLPFDFYINKLLLVEYDGEGHFYPVNFGGMDDARALQNCLRRKRNDQIKNQYCIDNNIPLVRIPYWEFDNIEYILENVLMHFNLIEKKNTYDESIVLKYLVDKNWNHQEYLDRCNK